MKLKIPIFTAMLAAGWFVPALAQDSPDITPDDGLPTEQDGDMSSHAESDTTDPEPDLSPEPPEGEGEASDPPHELDSENQEDPDGEDPDRVDPDIVDPGLQDPEGGDPGLDDPDEPPPVTVAPASEFYQRFVEGRLAAGSHFFVDRSFEETRRGDTTPARDDNFFGSIDRLDPDYDSFPGSFFLQYAITDYFGIGVSLDEFEMITQDAPYRPENTDGDITVDSTYVYVFARYPNETRIVPFAEFGYGLHDIGFTPEPRWAINNRLDFTDDEDTYFTLGVEYEFSSHFSAHLVYRRASISSTVEYNVIDGRPPLFWDVDLGYDAWGLGVKYTF